ncbi:MAG: hypothetical protein HY965_03885 [Ignavibacteriales bacterium]|nr:hypothetical protein [Ignavibacteriales bacterium]
MTFLTLPVSAESYMLGTTGAARLTDDPMAVAINPAQLGMQSIRSQYAAGYSFFDSYKLYPNIWHKSLAFNAGLHLNDFIESNIPLSFGIGYSSFYNQYMALWIATFENPFNSFKINPYEKTNMYSFSVGLDYGVKISAGTTYKQCIVDFNGTRKRNLYDFGLLVHFPMHELLAGNRQNSNAVETGFGYTADISLGYTRNSLGAEAIKEEISEPRPGDVSIANLYVPSSVQTGLSTSFGLRFSNGNVTWIPLRVSYSIEEKDMLSYQSGSTIKHQGVLGDINFFHDVVIGKTNSSTTKHKGLRVDFGEFVSVLSGRTGGGYYFSFLREEVSGWVINSRGLFKAILLSTERKNATVEYILQHLNIQYTNGISEFFIPPSTFLFFGNPGQRKFYSVNISWSNW